MKKIAKIFHFFLLSFILFPLLVNASLIKDPTRPPRQTLALPSINETQDLELTAIFVYPNQKFAIIDGKRVTVGDTMGELTVTVITPNTVELTGPEKNKEILRLSLPVKQSKE